MTLKRNTFEGLATGVAPTVATSGGDSGDAFSTGEVSFSGATGTIVDTPVAQGARALRVVATAGATSTGLVGYTFTANRTVSTQFFLRLAALPSAQFVVLQGRYASGALFGVDVTTAGALKFPSGAGGTQITQATSSALALNTWYRVDLWVTQAATPTASNGVVAYRVVNAATGVEFFANSVTDASLGTAGVPDRIRFAKTGGSGSADFFIDSPAVDDGLAAFITPLSDFLPPTGLSLGESPTGTVNATWNTVPTATGYVLERSATSSTTGFAVIATQSGTSYADAGRAASTTYYYRVKATK